jgi:transcriptional regulator with XRE-family HTH domain
MGRPKTPSLPQDLVGKLFRDRLLELMPQAFPHAENETDLIAALASRSGVGKETIRAALKGERSPRLVAVDAIARALGLSVAELLTVGKAGEQDDSPFRTPVTRATARAKSA